MRPLDSYKDILKATRRLLDASHAWGRFPTPVDEIVTAAGLSEPSDSLLSESVLHRAPRHLSRLFRKLAGRVLGVLDRRALEIHLDPQMSYEPRRRFVRLHEIVHHILPWQKALGYADDDETLSPQVRQKFERESNQGAAELLFQQERFADDAQDVEVGLDAVAHLAQRYGASLRATFRRYVEHHQGSLLGVVLDPFPLKVQPLEFQRREVLVSTKYRNRFDQRMWPNVLGIQEYAFIAEAGAAAGTPRTIVEGEWQAIDLQGNSSTLRLQALHTGYNILVLAWTHRREWLKKKVILTPFINRVGTQPR